MKYKETDEVILKDDYDDDIKVIPRGTKGKVQEVITSEKEYIVDFGNYGIVLLEERELK